MGLVAVSDQFDIAPSDAPLLEVLMEHRLFKRLIQEIESHPHKAEMAFLHSSLIVRGGAILAIGINSPSQNSFCRSYTNYDQTQFHAEFACVNRIRRKINLRGCTIYNCRMTRSRQIAMSKPCDSCSAMLHQYGFKRAVYTTENSVVTMKLNGKRDK